MIWSCENVAFHIHGRRRNAAEFREDAVESAPALGLKWHGTYWTHRPLGALDSVPVRCVLVSVPHTAGGVGRMGTPTLTQGGEL